MNRWSSGFLKACFTLLFLGRLAPATGQQEFASIQLGEKNIETYSIAPDDTGLLCFAFYKKHVLNFYIINARGEVVQRTTAPFDYNPEIQAVSYNNESFLFYYTPKSAKREGDLAALVVDKTSGKLSTPVPYYFKLTKSEEPMGQLTDGKDFFILHYDKVRNKIKVIKPAAQGAESKEFSFPLPLDPSLIKSGFFWTVPYGVKSIYHYQAPQKAYLQKGSIYLTFDIPQQFKTFVLQLDWDKGTTQLVQVPEKGLAAGASSNTFLYDDKLFRLTLDKIRLDLSVYSLKDLSLLRNFSYSPADPIAINKGPIYNEDIATGNFKTIGDMRNDKLFKTLSSGNASLFVDPAPKGHVRITMGSFNANSSGVSVGGAFGSFGQGLGVSIGGGKQISGTRQGSTFFDAFLSYPSLDIAEALPRELPVLNDLIQGYFSSTKESPEFVRIYDYPETTTHLTYIDSRNAQLKIISFPRY